MKAQGSVWTSRCSRLSLFGSQDIKYVKRLYDLTLFWYRSSSDVVHSVFVCQLMLQYVRLEGRRKVILVREAPDQMFDVVKTVTSC